MNKNPEKNRINKRNIFGPCGTATTRSNERHSSVFRTEWKMLAARINIYDFFPL